MNRALLDLLALNLRGRLVRWVRLLRQPKYLLAFLASACYFWWFFGVRFLGAGRASRMAGAQVAEVLPLLHLAVGLVLAAVTTLFWIATSSKPALRLNESEIHLLLPAPLSRREIIFFALLKEQAGILFGALVVLFFRSAGSPGQRVLTFVGAWALLTLADLHIKGISLFKARLKEMPAAAARLRAGFAVALGFAWWAAILLSLQRIWLAVAPSLRQGFRSTDLRELARTVTEAAQSGPLHELLAPFLWISEPLIGRISGPRLGGLAILLVAVAAHVEWAVRSRIRFEEATVERARRELARRGRRRGRWRVPSLRGRGREPFRLAAAGRPETAILWKNLMLRGRMPLKTAAAVLVAVVLLATALCIWLGGAATGVTATAGFALLCVIPLLSGVMLRNDLRVDLLHVEILRCWPIRGHRLVAAEMLAPAAASLMMQLLGCGLLAASVLGDRLGERNAIRILPAGWIAGAPEGLALLVVFASLILVGMSVALVSIAVQNLAALLFPGWVSLGMERQRGMSMMGQNLLLSIAHLLAMLLAALPAVLLAGTVWAVLHLLLGLGATTIWELPLLALAAALPLLLAAGLLVRFAGQAWDRLDPSKEIFEAVG